MEGFCLFILNILNIFILLKISDRMCVVFVYTLSLILFRNRSIWCKLKIVTGNFQDECRLWNHLRPPTQRHLYTEFLQWHLAGRMSQIEWKKCIGGKRKWSVLLTKGYPVRRKKFSSSIMDHKIKCFFPPELVCFFLRVCNTGAPKFEAKSLHCCFAI